MTLKLNSHEKWRTALQLKIMQKVIETGDNFISRSYLKTVKSTSIGKSYPLCGSNYIIPSYVDRGPLS